ncbi:hypothetical protein RJ639_017604 [Escallonia herrerae]|uniref:Uncharacterized protein n=1 Tax=Escallonia herrerae TaxID=1293975 RepID=A0AA88VDJ6_9ASTE|nr:hypothetical protein RJ639_017604 [Escallonia herrerae]
MAAATASFTLSRLLSSTPKSLSPISTASSCLPLKLHCPHPKPLRFSTTHKITATISIGDKLPESTFSYFDSACELQTTAVSSPPPRKPSFSQSRAHLPRRAPKSTSQASSRSPASSSQRGSTPSPVSRSTTRLS